MLCGIAVILYLFDLIIAFIMEGQLLYIHRRNKMNRQNEKLNIFYKKKNANKFTTMLNKYKEVLSDE